MLFLIQISYLPGLPYIMLLKVLHDSQLKQTFRVGSFRIHENDVIFRFAGHVFVKLLEFVRRRQQGPSHYI